jgi:hypothetical protein
MAEQLDDVKVKMGRLLRVMNAEKRLGETKWFYALHIEALDGGSEEAIIVLDSEVKDLPEVKLQTGSSLKSGRLYPFSFGKKLNGYLVQVLHYEVESTLWIEKVHFITEKKLKLMRYRASRNLQDIPEKSWLENMQD